MKYDEALNLKLPAKAKTIPQGYEVELIAKRVSGSTITFEAKMLDGKMFNGPRYRNFGTKRNYPPVETREYSSMKLILI